MSLSVAGLNRVPHVRLVLLSVAAAVLTVGLKFYAYRVTGSVGLLSDAAESAVNVVAALTALFALWFATVPADPSHPYGHEKIEFFSSGIEGGLILVAAIAIAAQAILRLLSPTMPTEVGLGTGVAIVAAVINFVVARLLLRTAKTADSIVLEADGHHLMSDVWTSIGVVAGLWLAVSTGHAWLDPLLALLVAANIVRIGYSLLRRSFDGLMDRALEADEVTRIRAAIEASKGDDMTYHALRTRRAGSRRYADYHLLVPGDCSVTHAHDCEMAIGRAIEEAVPGIEVTTHIEPIEEPLAWNDSRLDEARFAAEQVATEPLSRAAR
jgi:cation diffusion facilitator family transporter